MGWMEFVSSLVESLSWPTAAVVGSLVFRRQLREVLGSRLHRLKAGPIEMELFDRKLAETEADVDPIPRQSAPTAEGVSFELAEVAVKAPGAAVMEAHARVERRVKEILVEANLTPSRPTGVRQLAREAAHHGLISNESVRAIEGITVMRNLAAHGQSSDITADRAREYLDLVDAVMFGLVPPR